MADAAELPVDSNVTAQQMAETMFGDGIQIVSATYSGDPLSAGIYSDANSVSPGVAPSDSGVILSTGHVSSFTNDTGATNQFSDTSTDTTGQDGNVVMDQIAGSPTFDAAVFEAEFIPVGSILTMQITFSSEEYLEYVGSGFNDTVGVWVNGQLASLTVGDGEVSIDNINPNSNPNLYIDNADGAYNTEMEGFTVTLTLKAPVTPGEVNTILIGIADGGDASYDSNLMIAAESVQTAVVAEDDDFTVRSGGEEVIDLTGNDLNAGSGTLTITQINGQPVVAGSVVTLASGTQITVNADGTVTVLANDDAATPGVETFSYEVTNGDGVTDVGMATATVVACFVAGARIRTRRGWVPIEQVRLGDLVLTLDDGYQPVLWRGARMVRSQGAAAAVSIPAGMFGRHGALQVSPQHRLHMAGWRAQLYCGQDEVLVRAAHLVRAGVLRQDHSGRAIRYCHIAFDRHQIICAEGMWSESYFPGPQSLANHDADAQAELFRLFPALRTDPARGYGPAARPECPVECAGLLV